MAETYEQEVTDKLRPFLHDYLVAKGVKLGKDDFFRCIHPDHEDKHPSCSIGGKFDKTLFHCFSRGCSGDIFTAAHYLDKLPASGPEFFHQTLPALAAKFGVEYNPKELSVDDKEKILHRKACRDASKIITSFVINKWDDDPDYVKIIKDRDINLQSVKDFSIGAIPSVEEYRKAMLSMGWNEGFLLERGLLHPDKVTNRIFDTGRIIMTICDMYGSPIGFVARDVNWKKGDDHGKYVNSSTSSIYTKGIVLYGLDLAKDHLKKKPLCLVEGYIDVIKLRQAGYKNVAGLGSATLDVNIFNILNDERKGRNSVKIRDVILAFDGDNGGQECTRTAINDLAQHDICVRIKQLPLTGEARDPDEILKCGGVEAFEALEEYTPFKWLIKEQKNQGQREEDFIVDVCKQIAAESSPIVRRTKCRDIVDITSFSLDEIMEQVDLFVSANKSTLNKELDALFEQMIHRKKTSRADTVTILRDYTNKALVVERNHNQRKGDLLDAYTGNINSIRNIFRQSRTINGFKLNSFPTLQRSLDGFPDTECLISVAGDANIGKSSWMREIAWDLAKSNRDAIVCYMSIDDSYRDVMQSIVAREAAESREKVYKYGLQSPEKQDKIDEIWEKVIKQKNFIVADSTQGSTIMHLEDHIRYMRKNYPNKRPILFLDNFHKLRVPETSNQMREKFHELSQQLKDITQIEDIPIVQTVELRKTETGKRPTMSDIAETKQLEYDSKVIFMVHQELHYNLDSKVSWKRNTYEAMATLPYLELRLSKNKQTSTKCYLGYRFEPDRSIIRECEWKEIENARTEEAKARMAAKNANH